LGRLTERDITLTVSERFKEHLVDVGFDPSYGARPLRRAIMNLLEDVLAEALLAGTIKDGDSALVDLDNDGKVTILPAEKALNSVSEYAVTQS
ncbi:MAG: ATP-dependent Clp protease ATP-binding subunit ClpC, partial [Planktothrix sp.]